MFKAKVSNAYPELPCPPTWENMLEDLKLALDSDILFHVANKKHLNKEKEQYAGDKKLPDGIEDLKETKKHDIVNTACIFIQNYEQLGIQLENVNEAGAKLSAISQNLSESLENVKKQARQTMSTKC